MNDSIGNVQLKSCPELWVEGCTSVVKHSTHSRSTDTSFLSPSVRCAKLCLWLSVGGCVHVCGLPVDGLTWRSLCHTAGQLCTYPFVSQLLPDIVWLIHTDEADPSNSFISQRTGTSFARHNHPEKELMKGTYLLARCFFGIIQPKIGCPWGKPDIWMKNEISRCF